MRKRLAIAGTLLGLMAVSAVAVGAQHVLSPYRDQRVGTIRGLADGEIDELKSGAGMGLASAAELNGYAGPRHVIDAVSAGQLHAAPDQLQRIQHVFDGMREQARRLGDRIIAEEAALDAAFRDGTIDEAGLRSRVARIAALRGELRAAHLAAHLETRATLSAEQVARYNELRGYQTEPAQPQRHERHH